MDGIINLDRINPLRMQWVSDILASITDYAYIDRIVVFGSSIRNDCSDNSDLDIAIKWSEDCYDSDAVLKSFTLPVYRVISRVTKGNNDVVCIGYEGNALKRAIEEGVTVYERKF